MKPRLLLLFALLPLSVWAQSPSEILPKVSRLYDSNYHMDFEPIADLTYPRVVEQLGGREKFVEKLDADYQNGKFRKRLQLTAPIFQLGASKAIDGKTFCVITYRNPTRYFYEAKLDAATMQKEVELWKQVAGTKEVFGEPQRNAINVKRVSKFVAVLDESTNGQWKFFNFDDPDQLAVFDSLFAAETKKQLGL